MMKLHNLLWEKFTDIDAELNSELARPGPVTRRDYPTVEADRQRISDYIKAQGWSYLGHGAFSVSFTKSDTPWVMKVMTETDPGYIRFYSLAKRSDNPHFPEVGRMGVLKIPLGGKIVPVHVVMLEKLNDSPPRGVVDIRSDISLYAESPSRFPLSKSITDRFPELESALNELVGLKSKKVSYSDQPMYRIDLHSGNIMYRGNTPVIIDPLVGRLRRI